MELLRSVRDLTRPSPGCVGCWLSEEDNHATHLRYAEHWESEEDFYGCVRSDLYRRVLATMELSTQSPEVSFHHTRDVKGFELIEALGISCPERLRSSSSRE